MRKILLLPCAILALLCCSCGLLGNREYFCEAENITSVQIIQLDKYIESERRYDYTVLSQVEDVESFVEQLNDIEYTVNWGEPGGMEEGFIIVRIEYQNGDYDEIHPSVQCFCKNGSIKSGYFFFNREQFDSLISDYIKE